MKKWEMYIKYKKCTLSIKKCGKWNLENERKQGICWICREN